MLFPVESLKLDVGQHVGLWNRELLTAMETSGWLLDRFAFALLDWPDAMPAVAEALESLPVPILNVMVQRLDKCRRQDNVWHWPPTPGLEIHLRSYVWRVAEPAEAATLDLLAEWFRSRPLTHFLGDKVTEQLVVGPIARSE